MASLLAPKEILDLAKAGSISRLGAFVSTRTLNQAAGVAEGLLLAPSGTAGSECISPSTAAGVQASCGWSVWRPMSEDFDATHHYADNEAVAVMESGHMHVLVEGTCVANQPVFARIVSDGSSNTVLGKAAANSGGTLVIDTTANAVEGIYAITLNNGVLDEYFPYATDGSATTAEILAGLVALIDASANYSAAGTTEITITLVVGNQIKIVELAAPTPATQALWTTTDNQKCVQVPGAYFDQSRTGPGLVEIRQAKVN